MTSLHIDFSSLESEPDSVEELDEAVAALDEPHDWRGLGRWSKSFEALNALRDLVNAFANYGVFTWPDDEWVGLSASFDSDGECTETDGITITLLLPTKRLTGRFGVLIAVFISDIDDLFHGGGRTARERAEALAVVLNDAVADARAVA